MNRSSRCFAEGLPADAKVAKPPASMNVVPSDSDHFKNRGAIEPVPLVTASQHVVTINAAAGVAAEQLLPPVRQLLAEAVRVLQPGGLLFLYGSPAELPGWGEYLLTAPEVVEQVVFKYWIALDLNEQPRDGFLLPTHQGLLLFMKRDPARKTLPPFQIHTNEVR